MTQLQFLREYQRNTTGNFEPLFNNEQNKIDTLPSGQGILS